jgi:hypothetical protein
MANRLIGSADLKAYLAASDPNQKDGIRAFTTLSDLIDAEARRAAVNPHPNFGLSEVPELPDHITIAVSTLKSFEPATGAAGSSADASAGWPVIDLDKVQKSLKATKKFVKGNKPAIDSLKTLGTVLLHEVSCIPSQSWPHTLMAAIVDAYSYGRKTVRSQSREATNRVRLEEMQGGGGSR